MIKSLGKLIKKFTSKKIEKVQPIAKFDTELNLNFCFDPGFENAYYCSTYEGPKTRKFVVPLGDVSKEQAEQRLKKLLSYYKNETTDNWNNISKATEINQKNGFTIPDKEIKRVYSELDPYGEENWDEEDTKVVKPRRTRRRSGLAHFR